MMCVCVEKGGRVCKHVGTDGKDLGGSGKVVEREGKVVDLLRLAGVGRGDGDAAELGNERAEGRRGDERGTRAVVALERWFTLARRRDGRQRPRHCGHHFFLFFFFFCCCCCFCCC